MLNMMLFIFMWYSFFGKIFYLPYSLKEINLDKYYILYILVYNLYCGNNIVSFCKQINIRVSFFNFISYLFLPYKFIIAILKVKVIAIAIKCFY